jgi:hypothetical protein
VEESFAMLVAVFSIFAASRNEPFVDVVERVHADLIATGFGEPTVRFTLTDPPSAEIAAVRVIAVMKRVSSVAIEVLAEFGALCAHHWLCSPRGMSGQSTSFSYPRPIILALAGAAPC